MSELLCALCRCMNVCRRDRMGVSIYLCDYGVQVYVLTSVCRCLLCCG